MPNNRAQRNWPAQGRPGDHVQEDRIKDQDTDGVEAEVLYSQATFGFEGGALLRLQRRRSPVACFQAYNNTLAEWIKAAPDRLIPVGHRAVPSPQEGVAELERLVGMGFKAATVPTYPTAYGSPLLGAEVRGPVAGLRRQPDPAQPAHRGYAPLDGVRLATRPRPRASSSRCRRSSWPS